MKDKIRTLIDDYVKEYSLKENIKSIWGTPLVAFADADDNMFTSLKQIIKPTHLIPSDVLSSAESVISYFIPFDNSIINSNIKGRYSSKEWALAYVETNDLIANINEYLVRRLNELNYPSKIIPSIHNFDEESLMSNWSQRHVAQIAGLGKFGINNMLITEKGCCGRFGSIITSIKLKPTLRVDKEYCLYKYMGTCKKCLESCVCNALGTDSFDRNKCFDIVMINDKLHPDLPLTDVCGKCCVDLPCSTNIPLI